MASPADTRLLELLDKWLTSLELHTQYSTLDDDSYWKIQPWAEHQRPSRWIIDLAKQKTTALKTEVEERIKSGDTRFSDSLEQMIFLANLVGSEHIERFIPIAEPQDDAAPAPSAPKVGAPKAAAAPKTSAPELSITATREMPKFVIEKPPASSTNSQSAKSQVARVERKAAAGAKANAKSAGKPGAASQAAREQVIADAVRLVQWGRKWFELPELVARMAGRPPLAEVRRILKENKPSIEAQAKN